MLPEQPLFADAPVVKLTCNGLLDSNDSKKSSGKRFIYLLLDGHVADQGDCFAVSLGPGAIPRHGSYINFSTETTAHTQTVAVALTRGIYRFRHAIEMGIRGDGVWAFTTIAYGCYTTATMPKGQEP
jgi:hypothetical protein